MDLGAWLATELPAERLLQIELECRTLQADPSAPRMAALLWKQVHVQQHLLTAATKEIARLEHLLFLDTIFRD